MQSQNEYPASASRSFATAAIVQAFAKTARPFMRRFMSANSCIAAARTTIETMRLYRLRAVEKPVCYVFQVPARNYARLAGFSAEERAEMKAKAGNWVDATPDGGSWNGHLIVVVEDRWILDPSIDQADAPQFGVSVPAEVFVADTLGQTWHPNMNFEIELGLILDNGDAASLLYHSISDRGYLETEAWTDEGLPLLAHAIASEMKNAAAVSIACPKCGRVSHNANDVRERYCGNCHSFHDDAR